MNERARFARAYQKVDSLLFIEILEPHPAAMEIHVTPEKTEAQVQEEARDLTQLRNWWLQEYWQKKGMPRQQISIRNTQDEINIYNFGTDVTRGEMEDLAFAFRIFAQLENGFPRPTILIDNKGETNHYTKKEAKAANFPIDDTIIVFPEGRKDEPFRDEFPEVGNFLGTVIRELAHPIFNRFSDQWQDMFGWHSKLVPIGGKRSDGLPNFDLKHRVDEPERVISKYGLNSPEEDFCESTVGALFTPTKLDTERRDFLMDRLKLDIPYMGSQLTILLSGGHGVRVPVLDPEVLFYRTVVPQRRISMGSV